MKVEKKRRPVGLLKIKEGFSYYQEIFLLYTVLLEEISNSVSNFPYGIVIVLSECKGRLIKLTVLTVGNTTCPKMMMVVFAHSVKSHGTGAKGSHPEVLEGNINPKNKHFSRWAQKCHKRGHHTQMFN